jgi:hypothetical protein
MSSRHAGRGNLFFKTKMCFRGSACRNGDDCCFAHTDEELRPQPKQEELERLGLWPPRPKMQTPLYGAGACRTTQVHAVPAERRGLSRDVQPDARCWAGAPLNAHWSCYSESGLLLSINLTGAGHAYRGGLFPRQGQASLTLPRALSQQVSSFKVREQVISVTAAGGTSPPLVGWGTLRRHAQPGQSTPSRAGSQT